MDCLEFYIFLFENAIPHFWKERQKEQTKSAESRPHIFDCRTIYMPGKKFLILQRSRRAMCIKNIKKIGEK